MSQAILNRLQQELNFLREYTTNHPTRNAIENRKLILTSILAPDVLDTSRNKDRYSGEYYYNHAMVLYDLDYYTTATHWSEIDADPKVFTSRIQEGNLVSADPHPSLTELQETVLKYYPKHILQLEINEYNIDF